MVKRGLPFRDAHEIVAHAVRDCEQRGTEPEHVREAAQRVLDETT